MSTYLPNTPDYIPQIQGFQPDFNFLGNMLQTKQSQYDTNYKKISQTYGELLNSDMLRTDNIEKRNEFFKVIDSDIKKISGMDLSLQQNVESADRVFDSFFQNKDMVHDMVYTKEYRNQLRIGETYRNSKDPNAQYWNEGIQALNYKADEYKKATQQDAMVMSPGRYVPAVNIQEKAMTYAQDILTKKGFGIVKEGWMYGGKYIVKTTNGQQLELPLEQLLQNQYGQDAAITEMYNTKAYVQRKNYTLQNAAKFGGNEDLAEDEYFKLTAEPYSKQATLNFDSAQQTYNLTSTRYNLLAEKIKKGVSKTDPIINDLKLAGIDMAAAEQALSLAKGNVAQAKSLLDPNVDRSGKRNSIDHLIGQGELSKEIRQSATNIANLTGEVDIDVDPYAKSYSDFALDLAKMKEQYKYMNEHERYKAELDIAKEQAMSAVLKRGLPEDNNGSFIEGTQGTTVKGEVNELQEMKDVQQQGVGDLKSSADGYTTAYAVNNFNIVSDPGSKPEERKLAQSILSKLYPVQLSPDGKKLLAGYYNAKENVFVDVNGKKTKNPNEIKVANWKVAYYTAKAEATRNARTSELQASFLQGEGKKYQQQFDLAELQATSNDKFFVENNKAVKSYGNTLLEDESERYNWNNLFFTPLGATKTREQYVTDYIKTYQGRGTAKEIAEDAFDSYEELDEKYNKFYDPNVLVNGQPLVKAIGGNTMFNQAGGGKTAGGSVLYKFDALSPAMLGTHGLLSLNRDAKQLTTVWGLGGPAAEIDDVVQSDVAQTVYDTLVDDIRSTKYTNTKREGLNAGTKDHMVGEIEYLDTALSDKGKIAVRIRPSQAFFDKHKGTAKNPTWADDPTLRSEGITIYMDKDKATNSFTEHFKLGPYSKVLRNTPVNLDVEGAGKITILPQNANGSYTVTGNYQTYEKDINGKPQLVSKPLPFTSFNNDPSGDKVVSSSRQILEDLAKANAIYAKNNTGPLIYDVQEALKQTIETDGQPSVMDYFRQQLNGQ